MSAHEPWMPIDDVTKHRWIEAEAQPAHRVRSLWKFKLSQIDAWVKSGGADTRSEEQA